MSDHKPLDDDRKEAFLNWLLTPEAHRQPSTQGELADQLGVNRKDLSVWKKQKGFQREYQKRLKDVVGGPERVQLVVNALHEQASRGNSQAAKLYLEYLGAIGKNQETAEEAPRDLREVSDEDLLAEMEALKLIILPSESARETARSPAEALSGVQTPETPLTGP